MPPTERDTGSEFGTVQVSGVHGDVTMEQVHRQLSSYGFIDELSMMPSAGVNPPEQTVTVRYKTRTAAEAVRMATACLSEHASHELSQSSAGLSVTVMQDEGAIRGNGASSSALAPTSAPGQREPSQQPYAKQQMPPPQQMMMQQQMQQMQQMPQGGYGYPPPFPMQQMPYYNGYEGGSMGGYGGYGAGGMGGYGGYGGYGGMGGGGMGGKGMGGKGMGGAPNKSGALTGDEVKLFVGGLSTDMDQDTLHAAFSSFGTVREIHLMQPSERTNQRCAFVTFEAHASAVSATQMSGKMKMTPSDAAAIVIRFADSQNKRQRSW